MKKKIGDYEILQQIGQGTFGKVYKSRNVVSDEIFAMKKVSLNPKGEGIAMSTVREIKILKKCYHENVIHLKEIVLSEDTLSIFLVFEYMPYDLRGLVKTKVDLTYEQMVSMSYQILQGTYYLHCRGVLHRDLTSSNLLVNEKGAVKVCDFTLSREFDKGNLTPQRITLFWRSPEMLLGAMDYGYASDCWSIGVIIVEIFSKKLLFSGKTEIEQFRKIIKLCGTNWDEASDYELYHHMFPREKHERKLKKYLKQLKLHPDVISLVDKLLVLNPKKRMTCKHALKHRLFKKIREKKLELNNNSIISPPVNTFFVNSNKSGLKKERNHTIESDSKKRKME